MTPEAKATDKPAGYKAVPWRDSSVFRCSSRGCDFDHEYEAVIKAHVADKHPSKAPVADKEKP